MDTQLRASTATWSGPTRARRARPRARGTAPPGRERLGVYEVHGRLGEGGMATVSLATHTVIDRPVAIKRLLPELAGHAEAHALFLREARIAGSIRHPNVVEIFDFGYDTAGRPYYVMELAPGDTLAQRLEHGPLLLSQALDITIAVVEALAAVHRAGYVHRDVKSDNVMLARDDRRLIPKLIDFGIACRSDATGADQITGVAGTPRFMSPEQVARDPVDARTDIWGVGVLLYEMITGRLPFGDGATVRDDLLAIVTEPPRPLPVAVHADVRELVDGCLSKDPDGRPCSAEALLEELRSVQDAYLASRGMIARRWRATHS